jgi:hypothetical protein
MNKKRNRIQDVPNPEIQQTKRGTITGPTQSAYTHSFSDGFNPEHCVGEFSLSFLDEEPVPQVSYEDELITAEEKAAYYEDMVKNNGYPDVAKIAKDCRRRAAALLQKANQMEPEQAKPLIWRAHGLESLASYHENPDARKVTDAQRYPEGFEGSAGQLPDGETGVNEHGLPNLEPIVAKASGGTVAADRNLLGEKLLETLRKKAQFWRKIHAWNTSEQMAYYFCGSKKPADWRKAIFVRAQKDPFALTFVTDISQLLELARLGSADAAKRAVEMLEGLVRTLNLYAKRNPEPFRKAGRTLTHWPVMYSPHPKLNEDHLEIKSAVQLGEAYPFHLTPQAEWDPRELGCKIAMHLFQYVKALREHPESNRHLPFTGDAQKLPELTEFGAARKWWVIAEHAFKRGCPKPQTDERLRSLTHLKDESKAGSRIRERIKSRFLSLFPMTVR